MHNSRTNRSVICRIVILTLVAKPSDGTFWSTSGDIHITEVIPKYGARMLRWPEKCHCWSCHNPTQSPQLPQSRVCVRSSGCGWRLLAAILGVKNTELLSCRNAHCSHFILYCAKIINKYYQLLVTFLARAIAENSLSLTFHRHIIESSCHTYHLRSIHDVAK